MADEPPFNSRRDLGRESGQILCRALGFEPNDVRAITIRWEAGKMPYAEVELLLNEHAIVEVIRLRPDREMADGYRSSVRFRRRV